MLRRLFAHSRTLAILTLTLALFVWFLSGTQAAAAQPPRPSAALPGTILGGPLSFQSAVAYASGGDTPQSVAIGDLNGDGKPDLVVGNYFSSNSDSSAPVGVLLGNGDGTFQPAVNYESGGEQIYTVAIADVNGDGKPDIIVGACAAAGNSCGSADGLVSVLLGNGNGTFQPAVTYSTGAQRFGNLTVGDVNGDGIPDIIATNYFGESNGDGAVSVLLGIGNGTFQAAMNFDAGAPQTNAVAIGDVNGDGKPDLVAVSYTGVVSVLFGNGNGTFQAAVTYPAGGSGTSWVSIADVNGDGHPDIILANLSGTIGVLLGADEGKFLPVVTYNAGEIPQFVVADINGDGKLDIIFATDLANAAGILLGNGDGTFQPIVTFPSGGNDANTLAVGDLNGDGRPDIVVTNGYSNSVSVLLASGTPCASDCSRTFTSLASSLNPSLFGQNITLTATVSSTKGAIPDGEVVTFYSASRPGAPELGTGTTQSGVAILTTSALPASKFDLTATYSGDAKFSASSGSLTQVVSLDPTTTSVTSSANPCLYGSPVTLTAQVTSQGVTPPSGSVVFWWSGEVLGKEQLNNGVATLTKALPGTGTVIAEYEGNQTEAASSSQGLAQVVEGPYTTSVTLTSSNNPSVYGQPFTLTATVTTNGLPAVGYVHFFGPGGANAFVTVSNGVASLTTSTVEAGGGIISAQFDKQGAWLESNVASVAQFVSQAPTTTTVTATPNPSVWGQPVTVTAGVSGPGRGEFVFTTAAGRLLGDRRIGDATVEAHHLAAGTTTIIATYSGIENFASSSGSVVQTVLPAPTTATLKSYENPLPKGQAASFTLTVLTSGGLSASGGTVTFTAGATVLGTVAMPANGKATFSTKNLPEGTTPVTGTYSGAQNFNGSSASVAQVVE